MGGRRYWQIEQNPEFYSDKLTWIIYPEGGYWSDFDRFFPDEPKCGVNLNSGCKCSVDEITINYMVLAISIMSGVIPSPKWAKGESPFPHLNPKIYRNVLETVLEEFEMRAEK